MQASLAGLEKNDNFFFFLIENRPSYLAPLDLWKFSLDKSWGSAAHHRLLCSAGLPASIPAEAGASPSEIAFMQ